MDLSLEYILIFVFVVGYAGIVLEHIIHVDKTASALLTGILCWTLYILGVQNTELVNSQLFEHLSDISSILFFLMGAMAIVELIDSHEGFNSIMNRIKTTNKMKLLWILSFVSFFLSATLDNLTTSIIMISLLRKIIRPKKERWFFAGMIIIAANAGGAWTPIGDVTTTMLWIGGQITTANIMAKLIVPSLICMIVPLIFVTTSKKIKGDFPDYKSRHSGDLRTTRFERRSILTLGILGLIFVPIFKTTTHLPPFMGMLFSLGVLWVATELIHRRKNFEVKKQYMVSSALSKIDLSSVLFFFGILAAISCLESTEILHHLSVMLDEKIGNIDIIVLSIGVLSAIVDNVPLVAASMGMYSLELFPTDHYFWEFMAYCAGTGGSILIIGSAAGVTIMGMEKIDFFWYIRKVSLLAMIGYFAGAFTFMGMQYLL
jgi:Na+/H+ antiporter NhaD/arsenite permease-like protein